MSKPSVEKLPNRRDLLRQGGMLAVAAGIPITAAEASAATKAATPEVASSSGEIYRAVGVSPIINAHGTYTIITGSETLPQVKQAMDEASRSFVQMDELMAGVSKKLAELTQAPWGIITAGCCAALTHTTCASIAGTNPERMQRLPDLTGLKNEVIIPSYSRNVYDHAIRMVGVKIIEISDASELEGAFNERTALVYILAGPGDTGPLGTEAISTVAKKHNVPVIVDAAAEMLTIPNIHLGRGATAVAYSGGKCMRGPQAAGLLLGDRNLLEAAWANSAPHHAYGRSLKVGKEEIMGMLTAVEAWKTRNHDAEWHDWEARLELVSSRVTKIKGVTTKVTAPEEGLSNHTPNLKISWDANELGITGQEVAKMLLNSEPRIIFSNPSGARPERMESSITVTPYMLMPGEDKIVAERLYEALTRHPTFENPVIPQGDPAAIAGQWQATLEFTRGSAVHTLVFEQTGNKIVGTHRGEFVSGDLMGSIHANEIKFHTAQRIQGQTLEYTFTGTVNGDKISGDLNMGEYGPAKWSADRYHYQKS